LQQDISIAMAVGKSAFIDVIFALICIKLDSSVIAAYNNYIFFFVSYLGLAGLLESHFWTE